MQSGQAKYLSYLGWPAQLSIHVTFIYLDSHSIDVALGQNLDSTLVSVACWIFGEDNLPLSKFRIHKEPHLASQTISQSFSTHMPKSLQGWSPNFLSPIRSVCISKCAAEETFRLTTAS